MLHTNTQMSSVASLEVCQQGRTAHGRPDTPVISDPERSGGQGTQDVARTGRSRRRNHLRRFALHAGAAAALLIPGLASAQQPAPSTPAPASPPPVVLLDEGDAVANALAASARRGVERFQSEAGATVEVQAPQPSQWEAALRKAADQGRFPIIVVGANQAGVVDKVAKAYPNVRFTLVDGQLGLANVRSILFRREQSAYLAGFLSAMTSTTGKVGFVAGADDMQVRQVLCGFAQGARAAKPKIELFQNMIGAGNEATTGADLARGQLNRGADVVTEASRAAGIAILRMVADNGQLAVATGADLNALFPTAMLASAVKRTDTAVWSTLQAARDGSWQPGTIVLGMKEDGVALVVNPDRHPAVPADTMQALDRRRKAIADGSLVVHDFATDQKCEL